jgi:hypothetical protein
MKEPIVILIFFSSILRTVVIYQILVTSNRNWYMGDFFWNPSYMDDHSKDNLKNNYLIFKLNYFIIF